MKSEQRTFSDPSIPAGFLAQNKPFTIEPFLDDSDGKVKFRVEGVGINEALEELYSNTKVGFLDLIKNLKGLRSSIFALKAGGQR